MVSAFLYSLMRTLNKIYACTSSLPAIILVCMVFMKKLVRIIFVENFLFFNFYEVFYLKVNIYIDRSQKLFWRALFEL